MPNTDFIPRPVRQGIYIAFTLAVLFLGSVAAWHTAAGTVLPEWHGPTLAVVAYLSGALGLTALANLSPPSTDALIAPLDTQPVQDAWADDDAGVTGGDTP